MVFFIVIHVYDLEIILQQLCTLYIYQLYLYGKTHTEIIFNFILYYKLIKFKCTYYLFTQF